MGSPTIPPVPRFAQGVPFPSSHPRPFPRQRSRPVAPDLADGLKSWADWQEGRRGGPKESLKRVCVGVSERGGRGVGVGEEDGKEGLGAAPLPVAINPWCLWRFCSPVAGRLGILESKDGGTGRGGGIFPTSRTRPFETWVGDLHPPPSPRLGAGTPPPAPEAGET